MLPAAEFSNLIPRNLLRSQYDIVVVYLLGFTCKPMSAKDFKRGLFTDSMKHVKRK